MDPSSLLSEGEEGGGGASSANEEVTVEKFTIAAGHSYASKLPT